MISEFVAQKSQKLGFQGRIGLNLFHFNKSPPPTRRRSSKRTKARHRPRSQSKSQKHILRKAAPEEFVHAIDKTDQLQTQQKNSFMNLVEVRDQLDTLKKSCQSLKQLKKKSQEEEFDNIANMESPMDDHQAAPPTHREQAHRRSILRPNAPHVNQDTIMFPQMINPLQNSFSPLVESLQSSIDIKPGSPRSPHLPNQLIPSRPSPPSLIESLPHFKQDEEIDFRPEPAAKVSEKDPMHLISMKPKPISRNFKTGPQNSEETKNGFEGGGVSQNRLSNFGQTAEGSLQNPSSGQHSYPRTGPQSQAPAVKETEIKNEMINTPGFNAYNPQYNPDAKKKTFQDDRMTSMELDQLLLNPQIEDITEAPKGLDMQKMREAFDIRTDEESSSPNQLQLPQNPLKSTNDYENQRSGQSTDLIKAKKQSRDLAQAQSIALHKKGSSMFLTKAGSFNPAMIAHQNKTTIGAGGIGEYELRKQINQEEEFQHFKSLQNNHWYKSQQGFLANSGIDSIKKQEGAMKNKETLKGMVENFTIEAYEEHIHRQYMEQHLYQEPIKPRHTGIDPDFEKREHEYIQQIQRNKQAKKLKEQAQRKRRPSKLASVVNVFLETINDNYFLTNGRRLPRHFRKLTALAQNRRRLTSQVKNEDQQERLNSMPETQEIERKIKLVGSNPFLKRRSGFQEVPTILKELSNKQLRNKQILQKFVPNKRGKQRSLISTLKTKSLELAGGSGMQENGSSRVNKKNSSTNALSFTDNSQDGSDDLSTKDPGNDAGNQADEGDIEIDSEILEANVNKDNDKVEGKKDRFIIYPDSFMRATWDVTLFIAILYQAISLPFRISFEVDTDDFLFYLEIIIDVLFMIDILLNFNTGFYNKSTLILQRSKIARDYLSQWFWIDLVSSMPYTWILAWSQGMTLRQVEADDANDKIISSAVANTPQLLKMLKIAKLIKMLKLLRVVKIKRILIKFEEYIVTDSMDLLVTFLNITVKILIITHYMSCVQFYFGSSELESNPSGWLRETDLVDAPLSEKYITSMYWSFTTMSAVGYGEIVPITMNERALTLITIIASCGVFAFTINSISTLVSRFNHTQGQYRERMMYVNRFMIKQDMPYELRMKVRRYLDYIFESKKDVKVEEGDVFNLLNEGLRDKIHIHMRGRILKKINFINDFGLDFLSELPNYLGKASFVADDFIFMEGDTAESVYYIHVGKVAMIHKQSRTFVIDLNKEAYFGELGLLSGDPRCLSAKSRDFTEVFTLNKKDFEMISENYIDAMRAIRRIKDGLDRRDYGPMKMKCYICEQNHLSLDCPQFYKWRGNLLKMFYAAGEQGSGSADPARGKMELEWQQLQKAQAGQKIGDLQMFSSEDSVSEESCFAEQEK